jgi:hypothetical protein
MHVIVFPLFSGSKSSWVAVFPMSLYATVLNLMSPCVCNWFTVYIIPFDWVDMISRSQHRQHSCTAFTLEHSILIYSHINLTPSCRRFNGIWLFCRFCNNLEVAPMSSPVVNMIYLENWNQSFLYPALLM